MRRRARALAAALAERLFRLLLPLYPRAMRRRHGEAMTELFRDLRRDAVEGERPAGGRLLLATVLDAITAIPRAHRWQRRTRAAAAAAPMPATRRFGKETPMTTLAHDLAIAWRRMRTQPAFTLVAAVTLALGIGANVAIFSVVYGVLLRPIGIAAPAELAVLQVHRIGQPADLSGFWPSYLEDLRQRLEGRSGVGFFTSYLYESITLLGEGTAEEIGLALMVDGRFFRAFGAEPLLGRVLAPGDVVPDRRGAVCVLGEALWRGRFGADPAIVGRTLVLDGSPVEVVGVMPADLPLPQAGVDLWMPQGWDLEDSALFGRLNALARLAPGAELDAVGEALAEAAASLGGAYPRFADYTIVPRSLRDSLVGPARPAILATAAAVGLILLIACANMASLLLSRAAERDREMATRRALGAQRRQLIGQLLAESLTLAALGGALGVALAFAFHRLLLGLAAGLLPRLYDVRLDLPVLAFALLATLGTGLLFGLAPVAYTFTRNLAGAIHGGARGGGRRGLGHVRQLLVIAQVAVAVTLVAGAALMARHLLALRQVDPGFRPAGVGGARLYLDREAYPDDQQEARYFQQLLERLEAHPGILRAGATSGLPMDPITIDYDLPYTLPGDPHADDAVKQAFFRTITPGYLETVGIPLLRGRAFDATDRADGERVALINQTFARLAWPGRDPLGARFAIYGGNRVMRIVGVVGDVHFSNPGAPYRPEFFVPHSQITYGAMAVVARAADSAMAARTIAQEALALDPHQPVHSAYALDDLVAGAVAPNRFYTRLVAAFAAVALLLTAAGIYGVFTTWVNESRRELGVRMALGASGAVLARLVLRRSLTAAGFGLLVGLVGAAAGARALAAIALAAPAADAVALAGVVALLIAVALIASLVPALRAARLDPVRSLRVE